MSTEHSEFQELVDEILEEMWRDNPVAATYAGIHKYDNQLGKVDREFRREIVSKNVRYIARLGDFQDRILSPDEAMDHLVLTNALKVENELEEKMNRHERDGSIYPETVLFGIYILIQRDFAPLGQRMESALERMKDAPRLLAEGMENLRKGNNIPEVWTRIGIDVTEGGIHFCKSIIPQVAESVPELRSNLLQANQTLLEVFLNYRKFLTDCIIPKSNGKFAVGKELFEYLLMVEHQLPYGTDDLLMIGEKVLRDATIMVREVARKIDSGSAWDKVVAKLKKVHPPKEQLIDAYKEQMNLARCFVEDKGIVSIPSGEYLTVVPTPCFEWATISYAAYIAPAPFEEKQEGIFWVTPVDDRKSREEQEEQLEGHCSYGIVVTSLHEGYPGHHLQFVHANRIRSKVRRQFGTNVFAEGWALYCEEMMREAGFYSDPRTHLLQLKDLLWRACRVIIDVKLNTEAMTLDEAVNMLVDVAKLERGNAVVEVNRYTQTPTQPMSYVIGKLEIMKLRDDYKKGKGKMFDLREFHDSLLSYGTVPVKMVRERLLR
jgi:uncharacterized protein (DUF885 family)